MTHHTTQTCLGAEDLVYGDFLYELCLRSVILPQRGN